jgi:hypothetical protein
MRRKA